MREILDICTKVYWSSGEPEAFRVGEGTDGNAAEIYKATCKSSMIDQFTMYLNVKTLCCTSETNISYVNYTLIKNFKINNKKS